MFRWSNSFIISLALHGLLLVLMVFFMRGMERRDVDIDPLSHQLFPVQISKNPAKPVQPRSRPQLRRSEPRKSEAPLGDTNHQEGEGQSQADSSFGGAPSQELAANEYNQAREFYLARLRQWIDERKSYPSSARRLRQTGRVEVAFTLGADGTIRESKVTQPARYENLNQAALELLKRLDRFEPVPAELGLAGRTVRVPIVYELD